MANNVTTKLNETVNMIELHPIVGIPNFPPKAPTKIGVNIRLRPTPTTPPTSPIVRASIRNVLRSCPFERPLVKRRPISLLLRLKMTLETVIIMYHAMKNTGRAMIRELNVILEAVYIYWERAFRRFVEIYILIVDTLMFN